jgi:phosphatidylserine/phosphatidylglycerophosphate/cardiolipin synthase-like enzyme
MGSTSWSGPDDVPLLDRKSLQAMYSVIDAAKEELLLTSFVVYNAGKLVEHLRLASGRGVRITMLVEADKAHGGKLDYSGATAAGLSEIPGLSLYIWPLEKRKKGQDGQTGVLHAKCVVADRRDALVTSANLTDSAFHRNIELGVRITGGDVPREITGQFDKLIQGGTLIALD